jgi:hypothetical protein
MWDIDSYPHFVDNFAMISSSIIYETNVCRHTKADYNR